MIFDVVGIGKLGGYFAVKNSGFQVTVLEFGSHCRPVRIIARDRSPQHVHSKASDPFSDVQTWHQKSHLPDAVNQQAPTGTHRIDGQRK